MVGIVAKARCVVDDYGHGRREAVEHRLRRLAASVGAQLHRDIGGDEVTRVSRFVDIAGHANALTQATLFDALAQGIGERVLRELANEEQPGIVVPGQAGAQESLQKSISTLRPCHVAEGCNDEIVFAETERNPSGASGRRVDRLGNIYHLLADAVWRSKALRVGI